MKLKMSTLMAVIMILFLWKRGQAEPCGEAYEQSNFKLKGHLIKTHSVKTSHDLCRAECALHADCHSINYYSSQGICELNNANHLTNPESLVYSAGGQYGNYFSRAVPRCSNKLCSYPLVCKTDKDGQNYKCVSCEDVTEVISFPRKGVEDKVEHEFQTDFQLTAFTISMWIQADPSADGHTPFAYATVSQTNELTITLTKTDTELCIANTLTKQGYPPVVDGKWHHLCATWQNFNGTYKFYIDGVKQGSDGSMHQGHVIQKGALILGQEQDSYKGGFQQIQSYQGNLSSVNMWDRVLTGQEVSALAKKCPTEAEGNSVSWSTLKGKRSSGVKLICSSQCS